MVVDLTCLKEVIESRIAELKAERLIALESFHDLKTAVLVSEGTLNRIDSQIYGLESLLPEPRPPF